jgi:uncharacterized glyoxalase superfamily protein PhnB
MTDHKNETGVTGKYTKNGTPVCYTAITPFIIVSDPAKAIDFYEKVFGAKAKNVTAMNNDGQATIVHAELDFGNGYLQLGAPTQAFQTVLPPGDGKACYSLGIYVPDVDRTLARAVEHGATVREPAATFVSGDRYASILDPCGIRWTIMTRVEDLLEEESHRRVNEWSKSMAQS